jgi:hypothetical protein
MTNPVDRPGAEGESLADVADLKERPLELKPEGCADDMCVLIPADAEAFLHKEGNEAG